MGRGHAHEPRAEDRRALTESVEARALICIFVKEPRPGAVKTRLAAAIGDEAAADLAGAFFLDTLALATGRAWARTRVALDGDATGLPTLPEDVTLVAQGQGDLGARLERVLGAALRDAPFVLALGADSPDLPARLLDDAARALEANDAVLGPAHDGGFYLLGLTRCPAGLLVDLPWSASVTAERTLSRLRELGLSVVLLDPWHDVDVPDDLELLRERLSSGASHAPATAALLGTSGASGG